MVGGPARGKEGASACACPGAAVLPERPPHRLEDNKGVPMRIPRALGGVAAVALAATFALPADAPRSVNAASHREAPLISLDPAADITDFFMFRSYEQGKDDKVVLIMDVFPGSEPSSGPNYF